MPQAAVSHSTSAGSSLHADHVARTADLVFIQNGMLQPWLDERGLGDATQVCPCQRLPARVASCPWCFALL